LPGLVKDCVHPARYDTLGNETDASINFKAINYTEIIPFLIAAVKEQQTQINNLTEIVNNCCGSGQIHQHPNGDDESGNGNTQSHNQSVMLSGMDNAYLGQNIPNPFSDETRIDYYIPDNLYCGNGSCQIIFYDQLGRVIQEAPIAASGFGSINVGTKNLSNGILTYKLLVNGEVIDVKKMVFNK
jgi:hypothetical protein